MKWLPNKLGHEGKFAQESAKRLDIHRPQHLHVDNLMMGEGRCKELQVLLCQELNHFETALGDQSMFRGLMSNASLRAHHHTRTRMGARDIDLRPVIRNATGPFRHARMHTHTHTHHRAAAAAAVVARIHEDVNDSAGEAGVSQLLGAHFVQKLHVDAPFRTLREQVLA